MNGPVEHNGKDRNTDLEDKIQNFDWFLGLWFNYQQRALAMLKVLLKSQNHHFGF